MDEENLCLGAQDEAGNIVLARFTIAADLDRVRAAVPRLEQLRKELGGLPVAPAAVLNCAAELLGADFEWIPTLTVK
jgi:hypothetical protein